MDWSRLFQPQPTSGINYQNSVMIDGVIETVGYPEHRPFDNQQFIRLYLKIDTIDFIIYDEFDENNNERQPENTEIVQIIVSKNIPGYKYLEYCSNRYINHNQTPAKGLQVSIHHARYINAQNCYHCSELSRILIVKYKCRRCLSETKFFYKTELEKHDSEVHGSDPEFMTHREKLARKLEIDQGKKDFFDKVFVGGIDSDEEADDRAERRRLVDKSNGPAVIFYS